MGIDRPLFLGFIILAILVFCYRLKSRKKSHIVYPLADYLKKKKMSKPSWFRHLPLYLILFSVCFWVLALSGVYQGYEQSRSFVQAREFSLTLDWSGSMSGDPLKKLIEVVRYLIEKRAEDIFNITLFADQAKTAVGLRGKMSDFVTIESIKEVEEKMGEKLGSDTGVGIGLFYSFYTIGLGNKLFSKAELIQVRDLLIDKQDKRVLIFVNEKKKKQVKNQALILVSDFIFPSDQVINPETMLKLMKGLGIRIFLIKIGDSEDKDFQKCSVLAKESGGKVYSNEDLKGIFDEIDKIAKAPVVEKIEFQKNYKTIYFVLAGLGLFVLSIILRSFKKFREIP